MTTAERPIEECVIELLGHLGIERAAPGAAGGAPTLTDWHGLATRHPERIASLTVVSLPILDGSELAAVASACAATRRNRGPMSPPITAAMFAVLGRHAATPIAPSEAAGEAAGISYRIQGSRDIRKQTRRRCLRDGLIDLQADTGQGAVRLASDLPDVSLHG